jgi:hypothetical protein
VRGRIFCEHLPDGVLRSSPPEMATWHRKLVHFEDVT